MFVIARSEATKAIQEALPKVRIVDQKALTSHVRSNFTYSQNIPRPIDRQAYFAHLPVIKRIMLTWETV